jgi:hypothetical protein
MANNNSLTMFLCLPLMMTLWQDSSCRSTKMNNNSAENRNAVNNNTRQSGRDLTGQWGADGISVQITDDGAEINYDCAHGSITEKIVADRDGKFTVKGVHVREHPGPVREDEDQSGQPATYRGSISGNTMTLTVTLSGSDETVGTFKLTRGKGGRIRKCM